MSNISTAVEVTSYCLESFGIENLVVKKSTLPGAGKGLFTKVFIPKGTRVIEYKGEVLTWKEVEKMADDRNGYVFYFSSKYCLDAWKTKKSIAPRQQPIHPTNASGSGKFQRSTPTSTAQVSSRRTR